MPKLNKQDTEMCIVINDPAAKELFSDFENTYHFSKLDEKRLRLAKHIFVISTALELKNTAEIIREANNAHRLRAIFVYQETNQNWITQILDRAHLRTLRNLLVHSDWNIPRRVLTAWKYGAQENLIADAAIIDNNLFVLDCALNTHEIPVRCIPALSRINGKDQNQFVVSEEGSHITWPNYDLDINLDSIRLALDPREADKASARRLVHDQWFGEAIARFRKNKQLRQDQISGLSDRQLRRIEGGEHTTVKSLERLASAHGLSLGNYLTCLAEQAQAIKASTEKAEKHVSESHGNYSAKSNKKRG